MKTLVSVIMLGFFLFNSFAQKIEIKQEGDFFILTDKSGNKPKSVQYQNLFPCSFSKEFFLVIDDTPLLINIQTALIIKLNEYEDNLKMINDTCRLIQNDLIRFKHKNKTGLMAFPDKVILPAIYDDIFLKADTAEFVVLNKKKKYQFFYPAQGRYSVDFELTAHSDLGLDNKYCYLMDNEAFIALVNKKLHIMKTDGNAYELDKMYGNVIDINYDGGMLLCIKEGKYGFVDAYGNILVPFIYEMVQRFNDYLIVKFQDKFGLFGENGQEVFPFIYDKIEVYNNDFFKVVKGDKEAFISPDGSIRDQLLVVNQDNKYGFSDENGNLIIPSDFDEVQEFKYGFAPAKKDGKWGYILPTGHFFINNKFEDARPILFYRLAPVKENGKWGFIDLYGKYKVEPQFDSIMMKDNYSYFLYRKNCKYEFGPDTILRLLSVNPLKSNFTDTRDNHNYQIVTIGEQTWMAQNLNYKPDESWCYENNSTNCKVYGRLYTWKAALNACPPGWHLPSDEDWKILERTLGMPENEVNTTNYERGNSQAALFNYGGNSGFNVQMTGFYHGYDKNFYKMGQICIFWTSTPVADDFAYTRSFYPASDMIGRSENIFVNYGLPVRCVQN
jgi:uncharacterized protein (TIGR02145 family)